MEQPLLVFTLPNGTTSVKPIPDSTAMRSIEYFHNGRIKRIEYKDCLSIPMPDFTRSKGIRKGRTVQDIETGEWVTLPEGY